MKSQASNLVKRFQALHKDKVNRFKKNLSAHSPTYYVVGASKGGVGKSLFALKLALAWKQQGMKVLLFDADLNFPNLHLILGEMPKYGLLDFFHGNKSLKEIIFSTQAGVDLISGMRSSVDLSKISHGDVWSIFIELKNIDKYDKVIFDLGCGLSEKTKYLYEIAQEIIFMVTPDKASIINAYSLMKLLKFDSVDFNNVSLVMNKVNREQTELCISRIYNPLRNTCQRHLKITLDLFAVLPLDSGVTHGLLENEMVSNYDTALLGWLEKKESHFANKREVAYGG